MLDGEHSSGATEAALNLVCDQRDFVLGAELAKAGQKIRRRYHKTALALNRLDEGAGDAIGTHGRLEQLAHRLDTGPTQAFGCPAGRHPVLVRSRPRLE